MTTNIEFVGAPIKKLVTSKGADIDLDDIGLSISIPEQPFEGSVDSVELLIHPCLRGPFILPDGYKLASPAYLIKPSQKGVLQKPCTVRIQHISLQNETTNIEFVGAPIKKLVTSKGADIDLDDIGLSISIPEQPFGGSVDSVELLIHPCLSGPFILPDGYELASPVYVIEPSQQGVLQKPCTVRIQHYISLRNERDCDGMTFISANIAPQNRWFGPYHFKEIKGSKQTFKPRSQVGEIELQHFCCLGCAIPRWFRK